MGNAKVPHMWAPVIKEGAGAVKRIGRVPSAAVIKEGFPEEAASKHSLESCRKVTLTFQFLICERYPSPPFPKLTGLFKNFCDFEGREVVKLRELL